MAILQFEHATKAFEMWKVAFDRDPIDRRSLSVRRHRVFRPLDDPNYVAGELELDTHAEARACAVALHELWNSPQAAPALLGAPQVKIVEAIEDHNY